jgi:DNA adenine methylase
MVRAGDGLSTPAVPVRQEPAKQVLRYPGGKGGLKDIITRHFPAHRTYVEPYGGGASVLLHKAPSEVEFYNDTDGAVCELFSILRDGGADLAQLIALVEQTPYARVELGRARRTLRTTPAERRLKLPVEYHRCMLVASWMSRMAFSHDRSSGWLSSKTQPRELERWNQLPERLAQAAMRLKGIFIENRPALKLLRSLDGADTLFYLDPPFLSGKGTDGRQKGNDYYRYDMSIEQHQEMLDVVVKLKGKCLISSFRSRMYQSALKGWHCVETGESVSAGRRRVDCLWMNYQPPAQLELWAHGNSEDMSA